MLSGAYLLRIGISFPSSSSENIRFVKALPLGIVTQFCGNAKRFASSHEDLTLTPI